MVQPNRGMRRVLVVRTGSMFEEGVEMLLTRDASLEVRGVRCDDEAMFLGDVSAIFPDVIVLNEAGPLDYLHVFELIDTIQNHAPITIIVIRPQTGTVDVYEKRTSFAERSEDLLDLIRDRN